MKQVYLFLFMLPAAIIAQAQAVQLTIYNASFSKSSSGSLQHDLGNPATELKQKEFGGAIAYFKIDIKNFSAIKAKYRLELIVTKKTETGDEYAYSQEMYVPTKNGWVSLYSEFTDGIYNCKLRDKENENDVYGTASFTVSPKPLVDYKNNSTLVVCKTVDDNWMPVGETSKIKTGTCVNFLYKAKDRMNFDFLVWAIVKIKADGTEEYINHLQQSMSSNPYRYTCTTEGICNFEKPGKYRIYLLDKANWNAGQNANEHLGKTELTVE
mgnify:FL=1